MSKGKKLVFLCVLFGMLMLAGCKKEKHEPAETEKFTKNDSFTENETDEQQSESEENEQQPESEEREQQSETAEKTENEQQPETTEKTEKTENEQQSETTEKTDKFTYEKKTKQSKLPSIAVTNIQKEWYTDDNKEMLLSAQSFLVNVENEGFDLLQKALAERFTGLEDESVDSILEMAKEHYASSVQYGDGGFPTYSTEQSLTLTRCDSNIISFCHSFYDYMGGAHGSYGVYGVNFDVQSGEELTISDILTNEEAFYKEALDYLAVTLFDEYGEGLFPEYRETVNDTFNDDKSCNWYMTGAGIVIIYNPYELGPYAMGMANVLLPYEKFGGYIDEKYINPQGEVVAIVGANESISSVFGKNREVLVKTARNEYDMECISIVSGNQEVSVGEFGSLIRAYAVKHKDERSFLFLTCDYISDDYVTFVYEVTEGNIQKCQEVSGAKVTGRVVTPDRVEMSVRVDVFGTYSAKMDYIMDENGNFTKAGDTYTIENGRVLTVKKPVPVTIDGESVLLEVNSQIRITGTNDVNEAYFEVPRTGASGIIYYEVDDKDAWIHTIDGVSEYDYFETLPYAG